MGLIPGTFFPRTDTFDSMLDVERWTLNVRLSGLISLAREVCPLLRWAAFLYNLLLASKAIVEC